MGQLYVKKIILNNWGSNANNSLSIDLVNSINMMCGASGVGKSTIIDALQVVLFGSQDSRMFNAAKKTDSKEEKRSAYDYLIGQRKMLSPLRGNADFYASIVMEFKDTSSSNEYCVGCWFKVLSNTTNYEYKFFTLNGASPEDNFRNYSKEMLETLVESRKALGKAIGNQVSRIYESANAYKTTLYDNIFGGIDGNSFYKLIRNILTVDINGTIEDFMKTTLFVENDSNEQICEDIIKRANALSELREQLHQQKETLNELEEICETINNYDAINKEVSVYEANTRYIIYL